MKYPSFFQMVVLFGQLLLYFWNKELVFCIDQFSSTLPVCAPNQDNDGHWESTAEILASPERLKSLSRHLYTLDGSPPIMDALFSFSEVWVPNACRYHRFTAASFKQLVLHVANHSDYPEDKVTIIFVGDSTVRGLVTGVARLAGGGNETHGPLTDLLGYSQNLKKLVGTWIEAPMMDWKLILKFNFQESMVQRVHQKADWILEAAVRDEHQPVPLAVMYHSGLWDFSADSKQMNNGSEYCRDSISRAIAGSRINPLINNAFCEIGGYAVWKGVQLIYKNMHYNARAGCHCVDDNVVDMAMNRCNGWSLLDTQPTSRNTIEHQTEDGFHYDRRFEHTVEEHEKNRRSHFAKYGKYPGQLEMQHVQSYLNMIFHKYLLEFLPSQEVTVGRQ